MLVAVAAPVAVPVAWLVAVAVAVGGAAVGVGQKLTVGVAGGGVGVEGGGGGGGTMIFVGGGGTAVGAGCVLVGRGEAVAVFVAVLSASVGARVTFRGAPPMPLKSRRLPVSSRMTVAALPTASQSRCRRWSALRALRQSRASSCRAPSIHPPIPGRRARTMRGRLAAATTHHAGAELSLSTRMGRNPYHKNSARPVLQRSYSDTAPLAMLASRGYLTIRKAGFTMHTNQAAAPGTSVPRGRGCTHTPGAATLETCHYLRTLERISAWITRARDNHLSGGDERKLMGELWLLQAELSTALDFCPNVRPYQAASVLSCAVVEPRTN